MNRTPFLEERRSTHIDRGMKVRFLSHFIAVQNPETELLQIEYNAGTARPP